MHGCSHGESVWLYLDTEYLCVTRWDYCLGVGQGLFTNHLWMVHFSKISALLLQEEVSQRNFPSLFTIMDLFLPHVNGDCVINLKIASSFPSHSSVTPALCFLNSLFFF